MSSKKWCVWMDGWMDGWMDRWMDEEYYLSKINPQRVARIVGIGPSMLFTLFTDITTCNSRDTISVGIGPSVCVYTVYRYHDL